MSQLYIPLRRDQQGTTLLVGMIFLVVLTMLGLSALQMAGLEEKMVGNMRDRNTAFQAAEATLREAEAFLNQAVLPSFNNVNQGLRRRYTNGAQPEFWKSTFDWSNTEASGTYTSLAGTQLSGTAAAPRYVIEELPAVPKPGDELGGGQPLADTRYFRATVRAVGGNINTAVIIQGTYAR
jgi:type IV pilus assembly protein PilX